jgi:hypothetical protein
MALSIAFLAVVAYVIVEGTGIGAAPNSWWVRLIKNLFSRISGN